MKVFIETSKIVVDDPLLVALFPREFARGHWKLFFTGKSGFTDYVWVHPCLGYNEAKLLFEEKFGLKVVEET